MFNYTQHVLSLPEVGFLQKARFFIRPEIWLADGIADYQESLPHIHYPNLKMAYGILVGVNNVNIHQLAKYSHHFRISDRSGEIEIYWGQNDFFQLKESPEEVICEQDLMNGDLIQELYFFYSVRTEIAYIVELNKVKKSPPKKKEKKSLDDKVDEVLGQGLLIPQFG